MAKDDFCVVAYKILKYCYQCLKQGIETNIEVVKEISKVNDIYFDRVIEDLEKEGYITRSIFYADNKIYFQKINITLKGSEFLSENSKMKEVEQFLGSAFNTVLKTTLKAFMDI